MPMHEPPFGSFMAKDLCDTQRPVLLWQPADLGAHPFDRHENDEIARVVGRHYLLTERAGLEESRHRCPVLARRVEAAYWRSAERCHKRVVLGVLNQRKVSTDIAAYERRVRFCSPLYQTSDVWVHAVFSVMVLGAGNPIIWSKQKELGQFSTGC